MIALTDYICCRRALKAACVNEETDTSKDSERAEELRRAIKWDIWEEPGVKVNWLKDNRSYNKIQFTYKDTDRGIEICFLMGFTDNDNTDGSESMPASWKMWVGKSGAVSYADDHAWDLKTENFTEAVMKSLDIIADFVRTVEDNKNDYVAYYVHI